MLVLFEVVKGVKSQTGKIGLTMLKSNGYSVNVEIKTTKGYSLVLQLSHTNSFPLFY
jgi:hypothetical protein